MLGGQFKSINKGKTRRRHPPAGRSIKLLSYRKTGKNSCEKMTINCFVIFPTAVFPGQKICQLRNNNHRLRSDVAQGEWHYSRENPALYRRRSSILVCPACDMPSFAPCLHEETGTRILARATEAAKRPNKMILM